MLNSIRYWTLSILMIAFALVFTSIQPVSVKATDQYDALRQKWYDNLTGGASLDLGDSDISKRVGIISSNAQSAWNSMDKTENRTFLWSSYPFTDPDKSSDLTATYDKIEDMAAGYVTVGSALCGNASLKADILSAMDWMYANKYNENSVRGSADNWWDWEIGTPLSVNNITVMMYNSFSQVQISNYMTAVGRWCPDSIAQTKTGANRVWYCENVALKGMITKNSASIAAARDGLSDVFLYVTSGDGFYEDGSFIQHNRFAYTGGYGKIMITDLPKLIYLLKDSQWEVTDANRMNLFRWIYDGFEPLLYKGAMMDMVRGREISRYESEDHVVGGGVISAILSCIDIAPTQDASYLKGMVKQLMTEDTYRNFYSYSNLTALIKAKAVMNDGNVIARGDLTKYKQYAGMDRAVVQRPGYAFGISMHSSRIYNYEMGNDENLKGWHTGDGMTYLYNSDLSQFSGNFWPTVNSYRLPGTTVEQNTTVDTWQVSDRNGVGGAEMDGGYGVTGMWLHPRGQTLEAKKSWFMFGDEIVALGAGITAADNKTVETVVENRKLNWSGNNAFTVNGSAKSVSLGWEETMAGVNWAHLAGSVAGADIGYYFPNPAAVKGLREARTGAWSDINQYGTHAKTTSYKNNFLTLWFDHGNNPTDSTYSYVILPGMSSTQVQAYASNPKISILANNKNVQAVQNTELNMIGANFWATTPQSLAANGKSNYLVSDKKAAVMIKSSSSDMNISVSDPTQINTGSIQIVISESAAGVISKDSEISVVQLSPCIILNVNVSESHGKTFKIQLSRGQSVDYTFSDDFSSGNLNNWTQNLNVWSIVTDGANKAVKVNSSVESIITAGSQLTDTAYSGKVRFTTATQNGGLLFRYTDNNNFYHFRLINGSAELYKKVGGVMTRVASSSCTVPLNQWITLKVVVKADNIKGYVDNNLVIDWTNSTSELAAGKIGFRTTAQGVWFDDAYVTQDTSGSEAQTPSAALSVSTSVTGLVNDKLPAVGTVAINHNVRNLSQDSITLVMVIAAYDSHNQLVGMNMKKDITIDPGLTEGMEQSVDVGNINKIKVLTLKDLYTMYPLANVFEINRA